MMSGIKVLHGCFFIFLTVCSIIASNVNAHDRLTSYVDPFIGGGNGYTFPGATVPFGMVQVRPDKGASGIAGFSHMHLSGTSIGEWLDISVMPLNQPLGNDEPLVPATFSHTH